MSSAHFDYNQLLSGVSIGDGKDKVLAALSGYNPVVASDTLTISCPMKSDSCLYVKFNGSNEVVEKGIR
ncbi:hypothetical protein IWW47_004114 [Coemansia sp. RSA 2052]|nr:hypothetical protein IWW47_004114 [Coemansia sp. RSA 2052]